MTDPLLTDASGVLAIVQEEPGGDVASAAIGDAARAYMSAVNLAEVTAKLSDRGFSREYVRAMVEGLKLQIIPFDEQMALVSGELRQSTRAVGLSLGDRCCLATALLHNLPIVTADRVWASLDLGVDVILIR